MKKLLLLFTFLLSYTGIFAQLDTDHWFAPMMDRTASENQVQRIYASTNETTPFPVRIYYNNNVVATITISKNNPAYYDIPREYIITKNPSDLFKPINKGLYLNGDKPFYASLRFSVQQHGEILTSKGMAGIGTEFRAVMAPITVKNAILNFMTSVMATQDNTTVTVSDFASGLRFSDNVNRTQFTFTLNKGQSYIIDGTGDYNQNWNGFIGAKIVSDKPVSITNGNYNGQYAGDYLNSSDILMDQGVPVDKLGQEFVLMKGNGTTTSGMEKAIIVATVNGTQVFLNNNPTAVATLNAGQYYETSENAYLNQGSDHYNMYIRTTQNAYVYQLLAGTDNATNSVATGGFNYIPPLSCYLPRKIDEIGMIDQNRVYLTNIGWKNSIPTKLNIITEKDAVIDVKRNGTSMTLNAANGPFAVTGNSNWVTYSIADITGNISVESSHAVTAGISAGDDAVGYGGYFAGFSKIPAILKQSGTCIPEVTLQLPEGFDHYDWEIKDDSAPTGWRIVSSGSHTYAPTVPGTYRVRIKQGSCAEEITPEYPFLNCDTYTEEPLINVCGPINFTAELTLSNQEVNPGSITHTTPAQGNVTVSGTTVTYTPNPTAQGDDAFEYSFCGSSDPSQCETVKVKLVINQIRIKSTIAPVVSCATTTTGVFNLTNASITDDTNVVTTKFYVDDALTIEIPPSDYGNYSSAEGFVYAHLINDKGCEATVPIELKIVSVPVVTTSYVPDVCDEDIDGKIDGNYQIDLNTLSGYLLNAPASYQVHYFTQEPIDGSNANIISGNTFSFTTNRSIWVRVSIGADCPSVVAEIPLKTGTKTPLLTPTKTVEECDNGSGTASINLDTYLTEFTNDLSVSKKYYLTRTDAENDQNEISATRDITANTTFFYRLTSSGYCADIAELTIILKNATPSALIQSNTPYTVCGGASLTVSAEPGYQHYKWTDANGNVIKEGSTPAVSGDESVDLTAGNYMVFLTNDAGCTSEQSFEVQDFPKAQPNIAAFNGMRCDDNMDGKIELNFSTEVTPEILPNSHLYDVNYYANSAHTQLLPNVWTYDSPRTIYVVIKSSHCPDIFETIQVGFGTQISLVTDTHSDTVCDDDLDGTKQVDLQAFKNYFTTDSSVSVDFFETMALAQQGTTPPLQNPSFSGTKTFYARFTSSSGECPQIATLTLTVKIPRSAEDLPKNLSICPRTTTLLDTGGGFDSYLWSTGETSSSITVGIGTYWVELTDNGCTYRQEVVVSSVDLPVISGIEVNGDTATITVVGGNPPYQYSSDGINYDPSNVLTNLKYGKNTVYVLSVDQCQPVTQDFTIVRILNVITPNGDGYNDVLDYSDLSYKEGVVLKIFNRNGTVIFTGDQGRNNYRWDGKTNGRPVSTGTYWYVLQWRDTGSTRITKQTGWILVKNE